MKFSSVITELPRGISAELGCELSAPDLRQMTAECHLVDVVPARSNPPMLLVHSTECDNSDRGCSVKDRVPLAMDGLGNSPSLPGLDARKQKTSTRYE